MATSPASSPAKAPSRGWHPALLVAVGILLGVVLTLAATQGIKAWKASHTPDAVFLAKNKGEKGVVETKSGLQYQVLTPGKGPKPGDSDVALVNYEGKLTDGTTFDKSQRPTPMKVTEVVPGFSEALKLMPKGSKYRFWIKPSLGYGEKANGPIPANSVLVFEVEMLDFLPESVIRQMQMQQEMQMRGGAPGGASPRAGAAPKGK